MKKIIFTLIIISFSSTFTLSQQGWFSQTSGTYSNLTSVYFIDTNTGWTVSSSGLILKTTNGGSNWFSQSSGTTRPLNSMYFVNINTGYVVGGYSPYETVVLKTTNSGNNWVRLNFPSPPIEAYSVFFVNQYTGFISGNINVIYRTINSGNTWDFYGWIEGNSNWLRSLFFINQNTGWVIGRDVNYLNGTILRSTDGGSYWNLIYSGTGTKELHSLRFMNIDSGFAVGDSGVIIKTNDGGNNWSNLNSGTTANLNSIAIIPPSFAWVVGGYYSNRIILFTSNSGQNWITQINAQGDILNAVYFVNSIIGWTVGDYGTILKTTTGGLTYIDKTANTYPKQYKLSQNYPNPFNPSTRIKFDVAASNLTLSEAKGLMVKLVIYDILGHEITTLVNEKLKPGSYEVQWNASNFPSGVYFYSLKTESFTQTKRMVLIK